MKRYILLLAALVLLLPATGCAKKKDKHHIIGFYNLENLFDTVHDQGKNDYEYLPDGANEWTPEKYAVKLQNMARVIADMQKDNGMWHTVLGVAEIENRRVLEDLVKQPAIAAANYRIVQIEGPDRRGIDCALLYDPSRMKVVETESLPFDFNTRIPITTYNKKEQEDFRTRDIIMVHGLIDGEHFAFYVCHFPSRRGDKGEDVRCRAAEIAYSHVQKMQKKYPGIKCIVMGDMNDNPQDKSLSVYLHGRRNIQESQNLTKGKGLRIAKQGKYYGVVYSKPYMTQQSGQYKGQPHRTFSNGKFISGFSDHYPTFIELKK